VTNLKTSKNVDYGSEVDEGPVASVDLTRREGHRSSVTPAAAGEKDATDDGCEGEAGGGRGGGEDAAVATAGEEDAADEGSDGRAGGGGGSGRASEVGEDLTDERSDGGGRGGVADRDEDLAHDGSEGRVRRCEGRSRGGAAELGEEHSIEEGCDGGVRGAGTGGKCGLTRSRGADGGLATSVGQVGES
jgi:hypothetical protein